MTSKRMKKKVAAKKKQKYKWEKNSSSYTEWERHGTQIYKYDGFSGYYFHKHIEKGPFKTLKAAKEFHLKLMNWLIENPK